MNQEEALSLYNKHISVSDNLAIKLIDIVKESGEHLEGSSYTYHNTYVLAPELVTKRINLMYIASLVPKNGKIMEIGVNAAHSLMLFFLGSDPSVTYDLFDLLEHDYVVNCLKFLTEKFPDRKFNLYNGDSRTVLPKLLVAGYKELYDCIHLDGGHELSCVVSDFLCSLVLLKKGGYLIVDDTNNPEIRGKMSMFVEAGFLKVLENQLPTELYQHTICVKL